MRNHRAALVILLVLATLLPRLTDLGTILTTDEPLWQGRSQLFIKSLSTFNFARTATSIQPGVTTTWVGALAAPFDSLTAAQAAVGVTSSLLVLVITYFLIRLWGFQWGMVGGAILALDPFLIAHSRLIHTDALLALFLLLSFVSLLAAFHGSRQYPRRRYLALSGVTCALAILTKIFALAILPAVAAYIIYVVWRYPKRWQSAMQYGLLWFGICAVSIFLFWPALWGNAGQTLQYLTSGVTQYDTGTRTGEATSQWWYYLRDGFFRLTPPVALLAASAGIALARRDKSSPTRKTAFILLAAGISYAIILSLRGEKSDRYILFTLLTVDLFAVYGLKVLTEWVKKFVTEGERSRPNSGDLARGAGLPSKSLAKQDEQPISSRSQNLGRLEASLIIITLLYLAVDAARLHPYYLAHYNRLYPVEFDHKLGWGEGLEEAARYMEKNHPGAEVASYYSTVFSHFYKSGPTVGLTGDTNADYLILYRSMFERGSAHADTDLSQQYIFSGRYQPEHVITINGLPYVWIFKNE